MWKCPVPGEPGLPQDSLEPPRGGATRGPEACDPQIFPALAWREPPTALVLSGASQSPPPPYLIPARQALITRSSRGGWSPLCVSVVQAFVVR